MLLGPQPGIDPGINPGSCLRLHRRHSANLPGSKRCAKGALDAQAFDTLVLQISRIGGRNTEDCVHKVLDSYHLLLRQSNGAFGK
ncbi:hypothetical protein PO909_030259 [Leuciscus waleckii]